MQLWLIPILPLAGFVINGLFGRRLSKGVINTVAIGSVVLVICCNLACHCAATPCANLTASCASVSSSWINRSPLLTV